MPSQFDYTAERDAYTAEAVPSAPAVSYRAGTLTVVVDGLDDTGQPMPENFDTYEIHVLPADFVGITDEQADPLDDALAETRVGTLYGAGSVTYAGGEYETSQQVRVVGLDSSTGARTPSSAAAEFVVERIVGDDLGQDVEIPLTPPTSTPAPLLSDSTPYVITWAMPNIADALDCRVRIYLDATPIRDGNGEVTGIAMTEENLVVDGNQRVGQISDWRGERLVPDDVNVPVPTYWVVAVYYNSGGDATVSPPASIAPRRAGSGDLEVRSIKGEHFEADLVIADAIWTSLTGARSGFTAEGIFSYDLNGDVRLAAPNDPEQAFQFHGDAEIDNLTVHDLKMLPESVFTLQSGISAPGTPPVISTDNPVAATWDAFVGVQRGMAWDGQYLWVVYSFFGDGWLKKFEPTFSSAGVITGVTDLATIQLPTLPSPQTFQPDGGVAYQGGRLYVFGIWCDSPNNAANWSWRIQIYDIASGTWLTGTSPGHYVWSNAWAKGRRPSIVSTGTEIGVIGAVADDARWMLKRFTIQGDGTLSTTGVDTLFTNPSSATIQVDDEITGAWYGTADYAADGYGNRYFTMRGGDNAILSWNRSGVRRDTDPWRGPHTGGGGLTYVNGHFYSAALDGPVTSLHLYSQHHWSGNQDSTQRWWAAYSLFDNNATGGRHESLIGRAIAFTMAKRRVPTVATVKPPNGTGTDKVTGIRVYLKANAATTPPNADLRRGIAEVPDGVQRISYPKVLDTSGGQANSGQYPPFPDATPAEISSAKTDGNGPLIRLLGDGSGRAGPLRWDVNGASLDAGVMIGPSGDQIVTTAVTTVGGLSVTMAFAGPGDAFVIDCVLDLNMSGSSPNAVSGYLYVDNVAQPRQIVGYSASTSFRATLSQRWRVSGLTAGSHTLQIRVGRAGSTGTWQVVAANSSLSIERSL